LISFYISSVEPSGYITGELTTQFRLCERKVCCITDIKWSEIFLL